MRIRPESAAFTILLGLLAALPALSIDIVQPTLLATGRAFGATDGIMSLTITLFMAGFAVGQAIAGPLSDCRGRRPALLGCLGAHVAASALCAQAGSAPALVGWRLAQGAGAGGCAMLALAIIRDLFEGEAARVKRCAVTSVFALAPLLAPALGAWALGAAGWRPVYLLLAGAGLALLATVWLLVPESRPGGASVADAGRSWTLYRAVFQAPGFLRAAAVNACGYGATFAYVAGSPQTLMGIYGLSASEYGVAFAVAGAALTGGAFLSGRAARFGGHAASTAGLAVAAGSAGAMAVLMAAGCLPGPALACLLLAHVFCRGLTGPNLQHAALEPMGAQPGAAAAALGVMQISAGAVSSGAVALLSGWLGALAMPVTMTIFACGAAWLWRLPTVERRAA